MRWLRFSPIVACLCLAACGGGGGGNETVPVTQTTSTTPTQETTPTTPAQTTSVRAYFLLNGKVQPVERRVPKTRAVAAAALGALNEGLTGAEQRLGLTTDVNVGSLSVTRIENGTAFFDGPSQPAGAQAQIVYTLTQFPSVRSVEIGGRRVSRADFEDWTPAILVESPLPFQTVSSPLRVTGTANTFEATFRYEITDSAGDVVSKDFVTATSGSGVRGTFDFTARFGAKPGAGKLTVFESSAKDGSRIHVVEIPLTLAP
jgi:hypothetical protein